ncbi:MAG: YggT family protein [Chloroflexota bacterium]|nr:YggT family protein [Chloroflexota bacterium]
MLLAIRFVLRLLGANAQAGFAQLIYGVTAPLVAPFQGLFGTVQSDASVLESASLVALIVYALVAWLLVKLAWLVFGETRSATATTTRSTTTRR